MRDKIGRFKRIHKEWSLNNFNDGFIQKGRMRVYAPWHSRANQMGYVFRSIIAYETYHKCKVSKKYAVHHKNENKLDDSKENLEKLKFSDHSILHNTKIPVFKKCINCKLEFKKSRWRLKYHTGKFCSLKCYHSFPRKRSHKKAISLGLRERYKTIPKFQPSGWRKSK